MHFSEDDLRAALRRKHPGEGFTNRVMARVNQAGNKTERPLRRVWFLRLRPALVALTAVVLLVVGLAVGYRQEQIAQQARARKAEQQAVLALRIANAKLNRVFERVNQRQQDVPKVRRESL
jgi:hypothetical protein